MLTKINLDSDDVLELYFKQSIKSSDIAIKTTTNPEKKVFDFNDIKIKNGLGRIDAMHTVSIIPNWRNGDVRIIIDGGIANNGKLSENGDIFRINLKLHRDQASKNDNTEKEDTISKEEKSKSCNRDIVVIDAGHGGKDPGATSNGINEKDIVLAVAKKLASSLSNNGYKVYLTRNDDRFLTLEQRTRIADKKDAKIFISLHCNAVPNDNQAKILHGVETFFLQKTRDARSQSVAARENASVLQGADKKSKQVIIDSVLSGPKIILSNKLAIDIQKSIVDKTDSHNGGIKSAPFWVLVGASRPSILVELGYITNANEREKLLSSSYQDKLANGISDGISRYLCNRQKEIDN
jgi:N-acetylmuramoyl-L-alanine amidase